MQQIYSSSAWNYSCWQGVSYALDRNVFDCPHRLQRVEAYGLTSMVLTPWSIALSETHACMRIGELHEFELPQHGQKSEMQHPAMQGVKRKSIASISFRITEVTSAQACVPRPCFDSTTIAPSPLSPDVLSVHTPNNVVSHA